MAKVEVSFDADSRPARRSLVRAQMLVERSWWRRLLLRVALWRLDR